MKDGAETQQRRIVTRGCLLVLLLAFGLPSVLLYRQFRQQQRNHALIAAIFRNDEKDVVTLLRAGADANASDDHTPSPTLLQFLTQTLDRLKGKRPTPNPKGHSALMVAVRDAYWPGKLQFEPVDNSPVVKALLEHGANVQVRDDTDCPLLWYALAFRHDATVRLLLEHGANANDRSSDGRTALPWAACLYYREGIRLLLDYGADPNILAHGRSALMFATTRARDCMAIETLLLEHGANVNQADAEGNSSLMYAAKADAEEVVRCLLSHGADVKAKNKAGETALVLAQRYNHDTIAKRLKQAGAKE